MTDEGRFTIHLEHREEYEFRVRFDWDTAPDVIMDETSPLGGQQGPNAARMLAAAVANCLSASLLYCVDRTEVRPGSMHTAVSCSMERNENGRLRIGGIEVQVTVSDEIQDARRLLRCKDLFEDFCVVTASIREGIPVQVAVLDTAGELLHKSG